MPTLDAETWAQVRAAYEAKEIPLEAICEAYDVNPSTLHKRRIREEWPSRIATGMILRSSRAKAARDLDRLKADAQSMRANLIRRLYTAIDKKLSQMETSMQDAIDTGQHVPAADHERDTRSLMTLARSLERTTELNADLIAPAATSAPAAGKSTRTQHPATDATAAAQQSHAGSAAPATPPHDPASAERQRQELAQRIERIMAHRNAPRNPD